MAERTTSQRDSSDLQVPRRLQAVPGASSSGPLQAGAEGGRESASSGARARGGVGEAPRGGGARQAHSPESEAGAKSTTGALSRPSRGQAVRGAAFRSGALRPLSTDSPAESSGDPSDAPGASGSDGAAEGGSGGSSGHGARKSFSGRIAQPDHSEKAQKRKDKREAKRKQKGASGKHSKSATDGSPQSPGRAFRWGRILVIVLLVILTIAVALLGVFSWNRWHRFDDAADMQGQWYAEGSPVPITIDETAIHFDEKTAYDYALDPDSKTITYRLGNLEGQGHYRFCDERRFVVITDGSGYTKWGTALDDLVLDAREWFGSMTEGTLRLKEGDGVIVLSRDPNAHVVEADGLEGAASASEGSASASAESAPAQGEGQADGSAPSESTVSGGEEPEGSLGSAASSEAESPSDLPVPSEAESPSNLPAPSESARASDSAGSSGLEGDDTFAAVGDDAGTA